MNRKRSIIPFIAVLAGACLVSGGLGGFSSFFLSKTNKEDKPISATLTKYGNEFTTSDIFGDDYDKLPWIKTKSFTVTNYAELTNEKGEKEYKEKDSFVEYNAPNDCFKVVGIGKGKIVFTFKFDFSVKFTVSYESKFNSNETLQLLKEQYSYICEDNVFEKDELENVQKLTINSNKTYDFTDISHFERLKSIVVINKNSTLLQVDNLSLPQDCNMYVGYDKYLSYMDREEPEWNLIKNKIFVEEPSEGKANLILYKNEGIFNPNDSGIAIQSLIVETNSALTELSKNHISRRGYNFINWHSEDNKVFDSSSYIFKNTKLYSGWEAINYDIRFHLNPDNLEQVEIETYTYDVEKTLYTKSNPILDDFTFEGWGLSTDDVSTLYKSKNLVKNIEYITDLYALFSYNTYTLSFFNGENSIYSETITKDRGEFVQPDILKIRAVDQDKGVLVGWSFDPQASSSNYTLDDTIEFLKVFKSQGNVVKLYAVYESDKESVLHFYGDGDSLLLSYEAKLNDTFTLPTLSEVESTGKYSPKYGYKFYGWENLLTKEIYTPFSDERKELEGRNVVYTPEYVIEGGIDLFCATISFKAFYVNNQFQIKLLDNNCQLIKSACATFGKEFVIDYPYDIEGYKTLSISLIYNEQIIKILAVDDVRKLVGSKYCFVFDVESINSLYKTILDGLTVSDDYFETYAGNVSLTPSITRIYKIYTIYKGAKPDKVEEVWEGKVFYAPNEALDYGDGRFDHWEISYNGNARTVNLNQQFTYSYDEFKGDITFTIFYWVSCITKDTRILMADGTYKEAGNVVPGEYVMCFSHETGEFEPQPIIVNDDVEREATEQSVVTLTFDNGSVCELVTIHGYFDVTLKKYVYIDSHNYREFIGHTFAAYNPVTQSLDYTKLVDAVAERRITESCSPVSCNNLNIVTNNVLSLTAGIEGLFNFFEYDEDLKYNSESKQKDIETYGLFTYEDFADWGVSIELFNCLPFEYMSVACGKGFIDADTMMEYLNKYLESYGEFHNEN